MKKTLPFFTLLLCIMFCASSLFASYAAPTYPTEPNARACILMDADTGHVLYEKNADEPLPPASVTKVMTMLLVFEAIDNGTLKLTDMITASANAASMGGSQIYLKEGEVMSVDDLLKSLIVSSANDAAVALAEAIAGSETAFVAKMNERAKELGMMNTHFENTNGLDDDTDTHLISARDIAIMSREVMKHELVLQYSTLWMDTIRGGEFGLTNTNRLVRFYQGATGLKTGSTSKAKFCISATAKRNGLSLIAVVMGAPTRDERNALAASLLDFGFANYAHYEDKEQIRNDVRVQGGVQNHVSLLQEPFPATVEKGEESKIEKRIDIPEVVDAPIANGQKLGTVTYLIGGKEIGCADILSAESVQKIDFKTLFPRLLSWFLLSEEK